MATNPFSPLDASRNRPSLAGPSTVVGATAAAEGSQSSKKKKHRGGRKHRRPRRKSFAALADDPDQQGGRPDEGASDDRSGFYMHDRNMSNTSIDSEALLDHRDHQYSSRPRRASTLATSFHLPPKSDREGGRLRSFHGGPSEVEDADEDNGDWGEGAPLLSSSGHRETGSPRGYGSNEARPKPVRRGSSRSSWRRNLGPMTPNGGHNINYPPSMPGSPGLSTSERVDINFGDAMMREGFAQDLSRPSSMREAETDPMHQQSPLFERRHTIALQAEEDVCFPQEGMSEMADDDLHRPQDQRSLRRNRRRRAKWPDLEVLEEWSRFEKEGRNEERRMKKITEPQLINGRLRPVHKGWYRSDEEVPYRFTYFNEEFQSTIHSQTISELVQPDAGFRELFMPELPILSDSSESEAEEAPPIPFQLSSSFKNGESKFSTRQPSLTVASPIPEIPERNPDGTLSPKQHRSAASTGSALPSRAPSGEATPIGVKSPTPNTKSPNMSVPKPVRYGDRPVWWLDVLSPTEAEMKVLQKAFGIHPLTSEDIMLQEQREKVELFRHYYFVNYRSFDQDSGSATHLDPVNMYVVVFREGVISFHFSQTPHPANVRRRIRQLKDFMVLSADWISYAIIDDITDVFVPLIQSIEEEVDDIDDQILMLHSGDDPTKAKANNHYGEKHNGGARSVAGETVVESDSDMLKRVGACRKKVMMLYRLLGNKADVIKGFAKRCNEHWEVAPRSEIGLYLGDIQDHIITMNGNLGHYEM